MTLTMNPTDEMTDEELVRAAQGGDPSARDGLVDRFYPPVFALAVRMLGDRWEARDAAQETFLNAFAHLDTFLPERPFAPWIFAIAANRVRDRHRKRRPAEISPADEASLAVSLPPEIPAETEEDLARVRAAVDALPFDFKIVVALHFQQGCAYPEVAQALHVTVNAVRIRLYRALGLLRKTLKESRP